MSYNPSQNPTDWQHGSCDCFAGDIGTCLCGFFCVWCLTCQNSADLDDLPNSCCARCCSYPGSYNASYKVRYVSYDYLGHIVVLV